MSERRSLTISLLLYGGVGMLGAAFFLIPSRRLARYCKNTIASSAESVATCAAYERRLVIVLGLVVLGFGMLWLWRMFAKRRGRS